MTWPTSPVIWRGARDDWTVCFAQEAVLYEKACQKYVDAILKLRGSHQAHNRESEV